MRFRLRTLLLFIAVTALIAAALAPKPERYAYQCWEGGPHIVLPNSVADRWNGGRVDPFADDADYWRACEIEHWYGFINVGEEEALVIGNPPFVAWDRSSTTSIHYLFRLRAWGGDELDDVLDRAKTIELQTIDRLWHVPPGGAFMIFAADGPAGDSAGRIDIPTLDGTYRVSTGAYENTQRNEYVDVLRLDRVEPVNN